MKHTHIEDKFGDFLDGSLSASETTALNEHLQSCEPCQKALAEFQQILHLEGVIHEQSATLGPVFSAQVMQALEEKKVETSGRFSMLFSNRVGFSLAGVVAAMVAVVIAVEHQEDPHSFRFISPPLTASVKAKPLETVKPTEPPKNSGPTKANEESIKNEIPTSNIPPGYKAATIALDPTSGVEGWARPNSRVDVLWTFTQNGKQKVATLVRFTKILSVAGQTGSEGTQASVNAQTAATLLLSEKDAKKIELARKIGKLSLSLVGGEAPTTPDNDKGDPILSYDDVVDSATSIQPQGQAPAVDGVMYSTDPRSGRQVRYVLQTGKWAPDRSFGGETESEPKTAVNSLARVVQQQPLPTEGEAYGVYEENPRTTVASDPLSTFSLDVDTGSYTNVRRMLSLGQTPPRDSVRIEEFLNYFHYDYPKETKDTFGVYYEIAPSPLEKDRYLLKLGIKAREAKADADKGWNLVFLVDRSGSMEPENRLPLVKRALQLVVDQMRDNDRIAIVAYADGSQLVLDSTSGAEKDKIRQAIESLRSGGGTNGAGGIDLAYQIAEKNRRNDGVNRIVLATDGDFNVGTYDFGSLMKLVENKRRSGITLSTVGVGEGNYNEKNLEHLADRGNGSYFYLDSFMEARRQLVDKLTSYIETIAKDAKVQVEFNPRQVVEYRLIGYDNRKLNHSDFSNDAVDAGDIGAGHTVTALYEIVLANTPAANRIADGLRYQKQAKPIKTPEVPEAVKGELGFVKIRFKDANGQNSKLREYPVNAADVKAEGQTSDDFRFAAAVAYFGQQLRGSRYLGDYSIREVAELARGAKGSDVDGSRAEFIRLLENYMGENTRMD